MQNSYCHNGRLIQFNIAQDAQQIVTATCSFCLLYKWINSNITYTYTDETVLDMDFVTKFK